MQRELTDDARKSAGAKIHGAWQAAWRKWVCFLMVMGSISDFKVMWLDLLSREWGCAYSSTSNLEWWSQMPRWSWVLAWDCVSLWTWFLCVHVWEIHPFRSLFSHNISLPSTDKITFFLILLWSSEWHIPMRGITYILTK